MVVMTNSVWDGGVCSVLGRGRASSTGFRREWIRYVPYENRLHPEALYANGGSTIAFMG